MDYTVTVQTLQRRDALIIRARLPVDQLPSFFGAAYGELYACAAGQGAAPDGPPFARYPGITTATEGAEIDVEAGVCVAKAVEGSGRVERAVLPGGEAAVAEHIGPYDEMVPAYEAIEAWMQEHKRVPAGGPWELYHSDPAQEPDPQKWRTEIFWPLAPA